MHIEVGKDHFTLVDKMELRICRCVDCGKYLSISDGEHRITMTFHQVHVLSDWLSGLVEEEITGGNFT